MNIQKNNLFGKALAQSYSTGRYDEILDSILVWLDTFSFNNITTDINLNELDWLNNALELISFYLTRSDLNFNRSKFYRLLSYSPLITNLYSISSFRSTDFIVNRLSNKREVPPALAIFLNARNAIDFNRSRLFDYDPQIASEWYGQYFSGLRGFQSKVVNENLAEHLRFWDERMQLRISVSNGYMRSTYIDPQLDGLYKKRFNSLVKNHYSDLRVRNRPNGRNIAIVTARWAPSYPTHRNRYELFKELSNHFDLSLIHVGEERDETDTSIFKRVSKITYRDGKFHSDSMFNNDFSMVFYPDIGMNVESRFLSNIRFAPVQVTTNSHPVSTFGSEIDFFMSGIESELSPPNCQEYYSERLVLTPGIGTLPTTPRYLISTTPFISKDTIYIACPWGAYKFNYSIMKTLQRILDSIGKKVVFRFLVTLQTSDCALIPFKQDIAETLPLDSFELFVGLPYNNYMQKLSECSLALDPFPFGGNTSIIDCMSLGVPIVSRKGWQFYNMAGPVILERFGLKDLVANNEDEYIEIAKRLILDSEYRERLMKHKNLASIETILASLGSKDKFVDAVSDLVLSPKNSHDRDPLIYV